MKANNNSILRSVIWIIICLTAISQGVQAQMDYEDFGIKQYPFIDYTQNIFAFPGDSQAFERLFVKYDTLLLKGKGQLKIVHIGGSHIQADIYTNRIRQRLQTFQSGHLGSRGFVFPYKVAHTNNPWNYKVSYTGSWESYRNVERNDGQVLGLSGISITTSDTSATLQIDIDGRTALPYDFNKIKIFCPDDAASFSLVVDTPAIVKQITVNDSLGYRLVELENHISRLNLRWEKYDSLQKYFTLYGLSFENDDPGVYYDAIGINGAMLTSYMRCRLLPNHLEAIGPDLMIISIGTNDAYTRRFDVTAYKSHYEALLTTIRKAIPGAAILLTVPNDSYLYRRYPNKNTVKMKNAIFELAREWNCGVWDFYSVMGGFNSSATWYAAGMMQPDKVHFNKEGYLIKGDLLYMAFLQAYDNHIEWENLLKQIKILHVNF